MQLYFRIFSCLSILGKSALNYLENVSKHLFPPTKSFLTPYCLVSLPPPAPVSDYLIIILIRDPLDPEVHKCTVGIEGLGPPSKNLY